MTHPETHPEPRSPGAMGAMALACKLVILLVGALGAPPSAWPETTENPRVGGSTPSQATTNQQLAATPGPGEHLHAPRHAPGLLSRASLLLGSAIVLSAVADTESTVRLTSSGLYREANPALLTFSHSRGSLYAVKLSVEAGIWVLSARMRRSDSRFWRVAGWAVPLYLIAVQSWAAQHNWRMGR